VPQTFKEGFVILCIFLRLLFSVLLSLDVVRGDQTEVFIGSHVPPRGRETPEHEVELISLRRERVLDDAVRLQDRDQSRSLFLDHTVTHYLLDAMGDTDHTDC
jgi:hypothetical protein